MRLRISFFFLLVAFLSIARADDSPIRLNTIGFLPDAQKRASIASQQSAFAVIRDSDGAKVFSAKTSEPALNSDTKENLVTADFSPVKEPGEYHLEIPNVGRSPTFRIANDIYNEPFAVVMRGMYLWRCGTAISVT